MVSRNKMKSIQVISLLLTCTLFFSCRKEAIPPFTMHVLNAYDFDIILVVAANGCDFSENRKTNPLCSLKAGEQRSFKTYGPGRAFVISTYKEGSTEDVGSLYFVGQSGKNYEWIVGTNNPVLNK